MVTLCSAEHFFFFINFTKKKFAIRLEAVSQRSFTN